MKKEKTAMLGLAATSAMTLFSYIISERKGKNFKEPLLLSGFLKNSGFTTEKGAANWAGWLTHYAVGEALALAHPYAWRKTHSGPSVGSGLTLGALAGLGGIAIWHLCFKMHPQPPKTNHYRFYGHLFLAHIVFSLTMSLGYKKIGTRISDYPHSNFNS